LRVRRAQCNRLDRVGRSGLGRRRVRARLGLDEGRAGRAAQLVRARPDRAGVVANEGFNANAGFVVTAEGVVVFDALGTPALGKRLAGLIAATTPQPVRRVVVSHYHADHFYGLQALQRPGVEVWAHAHVRDYLATDAPIARLADGASRSRRGSTRRRASSRPTATSAPTRCSRSAA
jgi:glyoxylase-like metal-dependent hydrolase (beta-lactamase superfamily II)